MDSVSKIHEIHQKILCYSLILFKKDGVYIYGWSLASGSVISITVLLSHQHILMECKASNFCVEPNAVDFQMALSFCLLNFWNRMVFS